jgi:hypothetical protein
MTPVETPCPVCGNGRQLPADAPFCPSCGRAAAARVPTVSDGLGLAPGDRRLAVALTVAVALVMLLVLAGGVALVVAGRSTRALLATPATAPTRRPPTLAPPAAAGAAPPRAPTPNRRPAVVTPPPPIVTARPAEIVARPGDTDLTVDPLAIYAGGPPGDRLTLRGLRVGLPVSDVPDNAMDRSDPERWRDTAGDWCAVDAGQITEVHLCDPAVLARLPIDGRTALLGHFGQSRFPYDVGDGRVMFEYPARGLRLRYDDRVDRIVEVVLVRPVP